MIEASKNPEGVVTYVTHNTSWRDGRTERTFFNARLAFIRDYCCEMNRIFFVTGNTESIIWVENCMEWRTHTILPSQLHRTSRRCPGEVVIFHTAWKNKKRYIRPDL